MKRILKYLLLLSVFSVNAAVYKWTDNEGVVHYSDTKQRGSEQINLPETQTFSAPKTVDPSFGKQQEPSATKKYKSLSFSQPKNGETIRDALGRINISLESQPKIKKQDKFQILLDGNILGSPQIPPYFVLEQVVRGEHTLVAQIVNSAKKVLIASAPLTIYMHPPRVNMPSGPYPFRPQNPVN